MRYILVAALAALSVSAVSAQDDPGRFAPGNPWYLHFEHDCRQPDPGDPMHDDCELGVKAAWRLISGSENVACDYGAFWIVGDDKKAHDEYFEVLPWQYAVEFILKEGGVCRVVMPD